MPLELSHNPHGNAKNNHNFACGRRSYLSFGTLGFSCFCFFFFSKGFPCFSERQVELKESQTSLGFKCVLYFFFIPVLKSLLISGRIILYG